MKLVRARVSNYRSVENSEEFEIGDLTCLVGKNEAGKTALLSALRGLAPTHPFEYDVTKDYPRRYFTRFSERHPEGTAEVIRTWWQLGADDVKAVEDAFGAGTLASNVIQVSKGYKAGQTWIVAVDEAKGLANRIQAHALAAPERNILSAASTTAAAIAALKAATQRTPKQEALFAELSKFREGRLTLSVIDELAKRLPKFFYTSHFERMSGEIAVEHLKKQVAKGEVDDRDRIFLDFLAYAGTSLDDLEVTSKREELKALCEAASNDITSEIFKFWSQNTALEVVIDFSQAKSGDLPPFNSGTIAQVRIKNTNHKATLPLSERSAGFVWFFSFLAQFKQLHKVTGNAIVLLDEPGLTLHGRAQGDLLKYIVDRLLPAHQVIYTTHSPFMVPAGRLDDVRIVEDVLVRNGNQVEVKGTKVRADVLNVDDETLFPLQGALGYEITQTLFIGSNSLLVEGPGDIVYLQAASRALQKRGREGLSPAWTVCPSGGIDRIAPFVRLFMGNKLNVAVLSDVAEGDKAKIDRLRKSDILKAGQLYTVASFVAQNEADVEDLFDPLLFVRMLNGTYSLAGTSNEVSVAQLAAADISVRQLKKAEAVFRTMPPEVQEFGHYAPAEWLLKHPEALEGDAPEVLVTLDRFESVFKTFNAMLSKS